MKLYLVAPILPANGDRDAVDARLRACIAPIAQLIAAAISGDPALFALRHEKEIFEPPLQPDTFYDYAQAVRLSDPEILLRVLSASGDPFSGQAMLIRSLVTCRSVSYGYDGQAYVCLAESDPLLISTDPALICVEECSHLLTGCDWMDGLTND